ncbi:MAG: gliding motility protein GldN [Bacteroidales bacterium]|nr:gliding motility protein GldN [Bacteroidales bacterium]
MKKLLRILAVSSFLSVFAAIGLFAQEGTGVSVSDMPYEEIHTKFDQPMPYQFVREADVMWSRIIWRRIELSEKMNHFLALPSTPARGTMSLIDVVLDGIHTKGLTAYNARAQDAGNEFDIIMTEDDVHEKMGAGSIIEVVETLEGWDTVKINKPYNSADISAYLVKELWFFDKQRSVLDVRIIGLCPVRKYYRDDDYEQARPLYTKVFWINYPEFRPLFAKSPIYSPYTDVKNISFDDIFQKRYFSSYIIMESNPYRRSILQYESGLEVLLEADRIKDEIFNFEQDLWAY